VKKAKTQKNAGSQWKHSVNTVETQWKHSGNTVELLISAELVQDLADHAHKKSINQSI
jgi:hypothetical protein